MVVVVLTAVAIAGCGSQTHTETHVLAAPKANVHSAAAPARIHRVRHHAAHRRVHRARTHHVVVTKKASPPAKRSPKPHIPSDPASGMASNGCEARTANMQRAIGLKLVPSDPAQAPALLARLETLDIGGRSPLMPQKPKPKLLQTALDQAIAATRQWAGVLVIGAEGRQEAKQRGEQVIAAVANVNAAARAAGLGNCVVPIS